MIEGSSLSDYYQPLRCSTYLVCLVLHYTLSCTRSLFRSMLTPTTCTIIRHYLSLLSLTFYFCFTIYLPFTFSHCLPLHMFDFVSFFLLHSCLNALVLSLPHSHPCFGVYSVFFAYIVCFHPNSLPVYLPTLRNP